MQNPQSITILHIDDEPETVETIGEELYYRVKESLVWEAADEVLPDWTRNEERTQQQLVIRLKGTRGSDCTITYKIVFDHAIARADVEALTDNDVAIFDLMHNPGNQATIDDGYKLWKRATEVLKKTDRLFILTAFPLALKKSAAGSEFPPQQLLSKPTSPAKVVDKLIEKLNLQDLQ